MGELNGEPGVLGEPNGEPGVLGELNVEMTRIVEGDALTSEENALTPEDIAMLDFEKKWWRDRRVKSEIIRREFGISPTIYFRRLSALIDRPEALEYDPILVRALLRRRDGIG
ncbi:hypothetical protein CRES_0160 [Corynebacterium resistens DSM 45100]|uniref:DUF3263 domain-containing protein n=1 Tax=Corynebacterium resistens (strain DSM 45100 / JCM 12819 / GTC 2026 / SICGH 158) TaxID=662755 RepID=F8E1L8_CORRG|nr:DUF3263 domain-containing protein [Corynebacterium resistens]AEI08523.1 hypothetical protein CRES_0160 [Corynebacterium resistens DSM 45100]